MATITVFDGRQTHRLTALRGETIHATLSRYGIFHAAPCGGQGLCKQCKITARGELLPPVKQEYEFLTDEELLKGVRLACMALPVGDCQVFLEANTPHREEWAPTTLSSNRRKGYALGIDVGTTTLAVYLYACQSGQLMATLSAPNPQAVFGDDVISRIDAAVNQGAMPLLTQSVRRGIGDLIGSVCRTASIFPKEITACTVAANTTMLHLLAGLDPAPLGKAPFTPNSLFGTMYRGEQLDLPLQCDVYLIPCISAFVGGDVTAGIAACGLDETDQTALLIDVGTNGEMALVYEGQILCTSAAAGPAFEGAHIRNGVGGVAGAICRMDEQGFDTIDNAPPVGICGAGLIDALALMLRQGVLDKSGYLAADYPLIEGTSLTITPKDVRQVQTAKSAIYSGILCLCEQAGIPLEAIDTVYIAGGFGSRLNPQNAAQIGLIPQKLANKCVAVGNSAGLGAAKAALDCAFLDRLEEVANRATVYELSGDPRFNQLFIENMLFEG